VFARGKRTSERADGVDSRWPRRLRALTVGLGIALVASLLTVADTPPAEAANGGDFNPGFIISDEQFYNKNTMDTAAIQAFMNGKVPSCSVAICLRNYTESTVSRAATAYCGAYTGVANQTAAAIIAAVSAACVVNPQVLLVLLQKEQGLVTATAPSSGKFRIATGFGCPDTAPCESAYFGFYNQVYLAAAQFRRYRVNPASYGYRAGQDNTIKWHPNAACGTSVVFIENQATAGLYNYTPYRPNAAALANMGGTGDACSSYGNRNFFAYMTDWFPAVAGPPPVLTANATLGEPAGYLLSQTAAGEMSLHPGDGLGNVTPGGVVATGWDSMTMVFPGGDFDRNGRLDLIARDGAGTLWLYNRDGAGGWSAPFVIGTSWNQFVAIFTAGDFNGDSNPDVFTRDAAGRLILYPGNGHGGFMARVVVGTSWEKFTALFSPGDFNGDGHDDVMVRDITGNMYLYKGNGAGGWLLPRVDAGTSFNSLVMLTKGGDFDHDGHADILAKDNAGLLWIYRGDGAGGYLPRLGITGDWTAATRIVSMGAPSVPAPPPPPPTGTPSPADGAISADFTGDGKRDLLARTGTGPLQIFPGDGAGGIGAAVPVDIGATAYPTMFPGGDLTGDHMEDLVARDAAGMLYIFPGNGASGFGARVTVGSGWSGFTALFGAGDFNGDAKPDVIARDAAGNLWLYAGNGAGGLKPRVSIGTSWQGFTALFGAGDFTGDGKPDVIARDGAGSLWVYAGNGASWWKLPRTSAGTSWQVFPQLFGAGDFTGDGKVDVFAKDSSGHLWIYAGDGAGWWKLPRLDGGTALSAYTWIG
jgi:hypothetical protein